MKRRVRPVFSPAELILIRHGVTQTPERLCGRTDVGLAKEQPDVLLALTRALAPIEQIITSPARRCVETASAIWGQGTRPDDARLWEQDFGAWEDQPYADLPDIGPLETKALAQHAAPNGESFHDLHARVAPALRDAAAGAKDAPVALVVHAGIVRAALGMALGNPASGLAFEVAPLSVTRLRCFDGGQFSVIATNWHPA